MVARLRPIEIRAGAPLDDYRLVEGQAALVDPFIARGHALAERLGTRRVWMLNSTASGGGVAATLPHTCSKLREVGVDVRWLVLEPEDAHFFQITKQLHHLLHGKASGVPFDADAAACFRRVSEEGARALCELVERDDIVVVHDPQPCGIPSFLPSELKRRLIWRCHIGVPFHNESTEAGWSFLLPWLVPYARVLFTSERYVPSQLKDRCDVMQPAIDPLSHKNRELSPYKLLGILRSAGLLANEAPAWTCFVERAQRYVDGRFSSSPLPDLIQAPIILHVSRFDPLKGFEHSLAAFRHLVESGEEHARRLRAPSDRAVDELRRCLLLLAGPDPYGVSDDPEAAVVLDDLCKRRDALPPQIAARVHILKLPMANPKENSLMVNALQRLASVIVQPSVEEGFGLTVTEALFKGVPIVATNVGGIAQQIRPKVDGAIIDRADDTDAFTRALVEALVLVKEAEHMSRSGRRRASEHFLLLREALQWIDALEHLSPPP